MKKLLTWGIFLIFLNFAYSQTDPTLTMGLETLSANKGTIDVEALTEIIMEKQKELKEEALKRFMFKLFPDANYTTKFYIQNSLNILLNEKNPEVIEKELLELTTNYALALGTSYALIKSKDDMIIKLDKAYSTYKDAVFLYDKEINSLYNKYKKDKRIKKLEDRIDNAKNGYKKEKDDGSIKLMRKLKRERKKILRNQNKISNIKLRNGIQNDTKEKKTEEKWYTLKEFYELEELDTTKIDEKICKLKNDKILTDEDTKNLQNIKSLGAKKAALIEKVREKIKTPFGIVLDAVSLALSEIEPLREKGFFKTKIDYTQGEFYQNLENNSKFKNGLNRFKNSVKEKVTPYIKNYELIKEFLKDTKTTKEIQEVLRDKVIKQSAQYADEKLLSILKTQPDSKVQEIKTLIDSIGSINKTIKNKKVKLNSIDSLFTTESDDLPEHLDMPELKKLIDVYNKNKTKKNFDTIKETIRIEIENLNNKSDTMNATDTVSKSLLKKMKNYQEKLENYKDKLQKSKEDSISKLEGEISVLEEKRISEYKLLITKSDDFLNSYRGSILNDLSKILADPIKGTDESKLIATDTLYILRAAKIFPDLYIRVKNFYEGQNPTLNDINYFEEDVQKAIIELKILGASHENIYSADILDKIQILIPLLKIKIIKDSELGTYDEELFTLFEFIANLNNLDKAETFLSIANMLRNGSEKVEENLVDGKFRDSYIIFINAIKKYTLINTSENYLEVDVASFLNELLTYFNRNDTSRFSLYLSLGLNENIFLSDDFTFPEGNEKIQNIGFASEKLGLEFRLHSFRKFSGYRNVIKSDVYLNDRTPFINDLYAIVYGSGLLYSLANTATNENFDFAHLGVGVGLRFYNALDVNLVLGLPFVKDEPFGNNAFVGLGLDIPLGEYLERIGN